MKKFILLFLISIFSYSQESISYLELKKMTDSNMSEAVSIMKSKGFSFSSNSENLVMYSKSHSTINLIKYFYGATRLALYEKKNEYISNNILNTIKKLGYKERNSISDEVDGFCTIYESTNYLMTFCDSNLKLDNGELISNFTVEMESKSNIKW